MSSSVCCPSVCPSVPIIKVPPHSQVNGTGSSLVFLCEVFAFPMALVEWRKEGRDVVLPGDDPHISVQSRGGPLKFELSSWLQIEGAGPEDSGTYRCIARNNMGSASASAVLGVLGAGETHRSPETLLPRLYCLVFFVEKNAKKFSLKSPRTEKTPPFFLLKNHPKYFLKKDKFKETF
ncbi:kazal-type serine protease inhibitor domain-containing protein 1-like [Plectropomus leopardus]|uniref:kazal-type serine protease inhibitor domain-containing protein 1-like n=1 Tax=Plectropomus leopardus TaxID=160734 RepID=UPI001C4C4E2F|nr:kazal-type serine protease inhibitor domain-containing protein 1-like [Plectropomus leopardus]